MAAAARQQVADMALELETENRALLSPIRSRKPREWTGRSEHFGPLKPCPQWCASSIKATFPEPLERAQPIGDHAIRVRSWGDILTRTGSLSSLYLSFLLRLCDLLLFCLKVVRPPSSNSSQIFPTHLTSCVTGGSNTLQAPWSVST